MLTKKICTHCVSSYEKQFLNEENMYWYMKRFNEFWNGGFCACRIASDPFPFSSKAPEECPYIVEHTVSQDAK